MNVKFSVLELPHWTTIKKLPALQLEKEDETFFYHPEVLPVVNHVELLEEIRQETQIVRKYKNIKRVQIIQEIYDTMNLSVVTHVYTVFPCLMYDKMYSI